MALTKISTDGVKDDAITKAKIPADQIEASELANNAVDTNAIQDDAVTEDKLANSINTAIAANTAKDLTALSASNLTSGTVPDARFPATLPAVSGANLTNVPVRTNLVINGAMMVAQRGTSATSTGYHTVDRYRHTGSGVDENPTFAQVDVASGTTPYTLGFRKAFKITNGNQTSGAGAGDAIVLGYKLEAQDLANSGWNYTSSSSDITLSFWVRSSVAQNFYGRLTTVDGTQQNYPFETGSLSANTWTKITKTIPGDSNLQFDNNEEKGLDIEWMMFRGTNFTDSGVTLNAWAAYASGTRTPDNTATWYTTNDATFEITGVQLEVGSFATDFEHRSFAQELALCQRYFYKEISSEASTIFAMIAAYTTSNGYGRIDFPVPMRADGSGISLGYSALSDFQALISGTYPTPTQFLISNRVSSTGGQIFTKTSSGYTIGHAGVLRSANANAFLSFDAEL